MTKYHTMQIVAKNFDIDANDKAFIIKKAEKLKTALKNTKYNIEIIINKQKYEKYDSKIIIFNVFNTSIIGSSSHEDFYHSINEALEIVYNKYHKCKNLLVSKHHQKSQYLHKLEHKNDLNDKKIQLYVLTKEEAIELLKFTNDQFIIYLSKDNDKLQLVYHNEDVNEFLFIDLTTRYSNENN